MAISSIVSRIQKLNPFRRKGSVLGIDIGASSVKIVELTQKGGDIHLLKYGTMSLGPFNDKEIGVETKVSDVKLIEIIQTALDAISVKSRKGGISIPLKLSLIVTIEVPAQAESQLEKVVPMEARRYIPMPPQEVNIAWSVISSSDSKSLDAEKNTSSKKIKVLVAAIHNNTIENYQTIAAKSNINPAIFEIETFSAIRSVFGQKQGTYALIDIGAATSKILIIDYGSISMSHIINRGSESFTNAISNSLSISFAEAEKLKRKEGLTGGTEGIKFSDILLEDVNFIFEESKRVIDNYEKSNNKKVEKVVLIGGGSILKGLSQTAQSILSKNVELGNPFSDIKLPTPVISPVLKSTGPEFAVSVGLAIRAINEL